MRFSSIVKNSLNRLQMFFYRPQNLFWVFSSLFLSAIFLVLLPDNIYEFPNKAKGKLFQIFDFVVLIFSTFTLSQILDEKWASITAKKWKSKKKNYLITESFWAGWIFSVGFITILALPYIFLNFYMNINSDFILEYFLSRLSFLTFACFFGAIFLGGAINRYKKVTFLLFCLCIWKLPSLIIENFALGFFTFSLTNVLMPYGFNFSVFGGDGNLYSSLISLLIFLIPITAFSCSSKLFAWRAKIKVITCCILLCALFALSGKLVFFQTVEKQGVILSEETNETVDLYFSRQSIISNYSALVNDYYNYFWTKALLEILKDRKVIRGYNSYDKQKFAEINTKDNQKFSKVTTRDDDVYFYLKSAKKSPSFLGHGNREFKLLLNTYLEGVLSERKKKIGVTNLDAVWVGKNGEKSALLKKIERLYTVDVITSLDTNFNHYDLIIVRDGPEKKNDFYDKLISYFKSGGKIIWISDGFSLQRDNKFTFYQDTSFSEDFLNSLGVEFNRELYILPKNLPGVKNIKQLVNGDGSIISKCDNSSCKGSVNGIFANGLGRNFFLLPSYFNFSGSEDLSYHPILELDKKQFDVFASKTMMIDAAEVHQNIKHTVVEKTLPIAIQIKKKNDNTSEVILIGDKDIFLTSMRDDLHLNLTGKQILFSGIMSIMTGNFIDTFSSKSSYSLSPNYIKLLGSKYDLIKKRLDKKSKWQNNEIKKIFLEKQTKDEDLEGPLKVKKLSQSLVTEINTLTHEILNKFRSIRLMLFIIIVTLLMIFTASIWGSLFYRFRKSKNEFIIQK